MIKSHEKLSASPTQKVMIDRHNNPMTITFFLPYRSEIAPKNKQPAEKKIENILPAHAAWPADTLKEVLNTDNKGIVMYKELSTTIAVQNNKKVIKARFFVAIVVVLFIF